MSAFLVAFLTRQNKIGIRTRTVCALWNAMLKRGAVRFSLLQGHVNSTIITDTALLVEQQLSALLFCATRFAHPVTPSAALRRSPTVM